MFCFCLFVFVLFRFVFFVVVFFVVVFSEEAQIPNLPEDIRLFENLDMDLFKHVILTVEWRHPQGMTIIER